jgi:hypothetical protein
VQSSTPNTISSPSVGFAPDDEAPYRTISILSIVGLILGIAAPLAFFAPLLYAIPIAGIIVTLLAIRKISLSDGALIGRKAAVIGLALSVVGLTAAATRTMMFQELLSRQARAAALQWIELLQSGNAETAYKLTSAGRQRAPTTPADPSEATSQASPLDSFRADTVPHFLLDHAQDAPVTFVRDSVFDPATPGNERIQQLYQVGVPAETNGAATTTLTVMLQRVQASDAIPAQWLIAAYNSDDLATQPDEHDHSGHDHSGHGH